MLKSVTSDWNVLPIHVHPWLALIWRYISCPPMQVSTLPLRSPVPSPLLSLKLLGYTWYITSFCHHIKLGRWGQRGATTMMITAAANIANQATQKRISIIQRTRIQYGSSAYFINSSLVRPTNSWSLPVSPISTFASPTGSAVPPLINFTLDESISESGYEGNPPSAD